MLDVIWDGLYFILKIFFSYSLCKDLVEIENSLSLVFVLNMAFHLSLIIAVSRHLSIV